MVFGLVKAELQKVYDGILVMMDKNIIPSESTGDTQVFDFKVKGGRYGFEFAPRDAESKAVENARVAHAEDTETAGKDQVATYPIRLDLILNFSVHQHEVIQNPDEACEMAYVTSEDAIMEPDNVHYTEVSRMSAVIQFGPGAVDDPFVKVKSLITDLITRLQAESLSQTSHKCYCGEEMHKHTVRGTVEAEARQPYCNSKQQPAKHAAQDREKEGKKEGRERKVRKKGRRKERVKEKWSKKWTRKKLGRTPRRRKEGKLRKRKTRRLLRT